jgi:hypothetical protein
VPDGGLDAEKLSLLGKWAEGLQADPRAEVAASGKAILMLIEEIERLHVVVWDGRLNPASTPELNSSKETSTIFRRGFTACAIASQPTPRDSPQAPQGFPQAAARPEDTRRPFADVHELG